MSRDRRIDYLELPAADLAAVERFYAAVFGWTFVDYGDDYKAFNDGRLDGGFYRSELRSETANGAALIVFFSDDLLGCKRAVIEHGGRIGTAPFDFPGGARFHFFDPHGNELAVWTDRSVAELSGEGRGDAAN